MKKFLFLIIASFAVCLSVVAQTSAYYDVQRLCISKGYSIGLEEQGLANQGSTVYSWVNFTGGNDYIIVAMSDDSDVKDVDVFLYTESGILLKKDADESNLGMIFFSPRYNNRLKIIIKNYRSDTPNYRSTLRYFIAYR